jgi:hypothetical protein
MRTIILFSLLLSSFSFAQTQLEINSIQEDVLINEIADVVDLDSTCVDEYLQRQANIKKFLIWAPPVTLVGTPVGVFIGGNVAAFISSTLLGQGWAALGWTVLGAMGGGAAVLVTGTTMTISRAVEYNNNSKMIEIIGASHAQAYDNKRLIKAHSRYNQKYDQSISLEAFAENIQKLDINGALCNGEVRGDTNPRNLKHSLAKRRHLLNYIYFQSSSP